MVVLNRIVSKVIKFIEKINKILARDQQVFFRFC